jgi:hypothetical protein
VTHATDVSQPAGQAGVDIEELLADPDNGPPERTVWLLLNRTLRRRWDELARAMADAPVKATSLGEIAPAKAVAREMDAVREQMRAAEKPFRLVASEPRTWAAFQDTKPERAAGQPEKEWQTVWHAWVCQMVANACVDPVMTAEQVDRLCGRLSNAQWLELSNTAWDLNSEREKVPFSAVVFALTRDDGDSSRQHETSESPSPGS